MNHFDTQESIKSLRDSMGVTFPMVKEELGMRDAFGIANYPTTVFVNSNGKIVSIHTAAFESEEAFFNTIESFLK